MFLNPLTKPHSSTMRNSKDEQFFSIATNDVSNNNNFWRRQEFFGENNEKKVHQKDFWGKFDEALKHKNLRNSHKRMQATLHVHIITIKKDK